jgi:hypothetical protein
VTQTSSDLIDLGGGVTVHPGALSPQMVEAGILTPHPDNPRNGDTDIIGESLDTNALYKPVVVQASSHRILAGNHTYAALMERGVTHIPVILLDVDDDQAVRILLADNRTSDLGTYDTGLLMSMLADLTDQGANLNVLVGTGYDEAALIQLAHHPDLMDDATDFLTGFGQTPETPLEDSTVVGGDPTGSPYFQMVWVVTETQRDTIRTRIRQVQQSLPADGDRPVTSTDALLAIVEGRA